MIFEGVSSSNIIIVGWVINVISVGVSIGVLIHSEISIIGEEQAVPRFLLLFILLGLVTIGLIVSLEHCPLGDIKLLLGDHSGEGL